MSQCDVPFAKCSVKSLEEGGSDIRHSCLGWASNAPNETSRTKEARKQRAFHLSKTKPQIHRRKLQTSRMEPRMHRTHRRPTLKENSAAALPSTSGTHARGTEERCSRTQTNKRWASALGSFKTNPQMYQMKPRMRLKCTRASNTKTSPPLLLLLLSSALTVWPSPAGDEKGCGGAVFAI